jgi:hypothetical protein
MSSDTPRTDEVMERGQLQRPTLSELADHARTLERELAAAKETIGNQRERIRYLEGATNHAGGTLLSAVTKDRDEARAALREIANMKGDESVPLEIRAFELVGRMFFAAKAVLSKAAGEGAK